MNNHTGYGSAVPTHRFLFISLPPSLPPSLPHVPSVEACTVTPRESVSKWPITSVMSRMTWREGRRDGRREGGTEGKEEDLAERMEGGREEGREGQFSRREGGRKGGRKGGEHLPPP